MTEDEITFPPPKRTFVGTVVKDMKMARNSQAWALGEQKKNGFHVRRVVWGKLMASVERRPGEEIRRATICIAQKASRPVAPLASLTGRKDE